MITVTLEGLAEFRSRVINACTALELDVREGVLDAARVGIEAAQRDHSYQDRTFVLTGYQSGPDGSTSAVQVRDVVTGEEAAEMTWPAFYASFVDEGTSRSRKYPFTPQARRAAQAKLQTNMQRAAEKFERNLTG